MEKIQTAEEYLKEKYPGEFIEADATNLFNIDETKRLMIEFAKLHVQATLKSAADTTEVEFNTDFHRSQFESCYPFDNIK